MQQVCVLRWRFSQPLLHHRTKSNLHNLLPLLFDEGLPAKVAEAFRVLGLAAHAIGDDGAPVRKSTDRTNCEWCKANAAVLITNDRGRKDPTILDHLAEQHAHAIFIYNDLRAAEEHELACAVLRAEKRIEEIAAKQLLRHRLRPGGGLEKR